MAGCIPYSPLYIYATSGRNLKSIRRIPQNQTFRFYLSLPAPRFPNLPECQGCLPCPARLWQPRFSAGRGTYSPFKCPAPHPVIFSRRESDSLDDAFPVFWMPTLPCPAMAYWGYVPISFISCYAFASKLFCGFSAFTTSSPASGMPLFAFPHASL